MNLKRVIVVHYGEIGLKGQNRSDFLNQLKRNIEFTISKIGAKGTIRILPGLLKIELSDPPLERLPQTWVQTLQRVFGIVWFAPAYEVPHSGFANPSDFDTLQSALISVVSSLPVPEGGFAVRVRRGDKRLPFHSDEMERKLGATILKNTPWTKVNLTNPQITVEVDFRDRESLIYTERIPGPGGLPVGVTGHVIGLLSGGIDSSVAMWLVGKRGCTVDFLHFAIEEFPPDVIKNSNVYALASLLSEWLLHVRLHVVPYTYFDIALLKHPTPFGLVLFRRFMLRVAEKLAQQTGAQAIVTGDNLAQVASQTLSNLVTTSAAVKIPVFRPLLCYDKTEIIELARKIGTFPISIQPYKDCCALIERHPKTKSSPEKIEKIESEIFPEYEKIVDQTLKAIQTFEFGHTARLCTQHE